MVGLVTGLNVGDIVGPKVGLTVGEVVGLWVGDVVGLMVGGQSTITSKVQKALCRDPLLSLMTHLTRVLPSLKVSPLSRPRANLNVLGQLSTACTS